MSLRDLAKRHLATMAKPMLSGVRTYRDVRPGQNGSTPYFSRDRACPDAGHDPDKLSGPDECEVPGQTGQVGHFGQLGQTGQVGQSGRAPIPATASLEDRRASVEAIYAQMEAERERRRDWHAQPVEGWRDGRLTIRNIARDETVDIDFRKWRSGR
jgi:hypothetical protein